jgi:hypothetical protein
LRNTERSRRHVRSLLLLFLLPQLCAATGDERLISFEKGGGGFPLTVSGRTVPVCASSRELPGVLRILELFRKDIAGVTGSVPALLLDTLPPSRTLVVVGTLGRSPLIDTLVRRGKIDVRGIAGEWEASLVQSVEHPFPGVDRALVIAGSDKRGTIYAMFRISGQIGVSPWYWWADVPLQRHASLYVLPGRHVDGPPSVKYRGIFLNDEFPALSKWIRAKYGEVRLGVDPPIPPGVANYGHEFYERIFEVLLRLKGNYLWPAMWDNAFNEDDALNPRLADEYGIVMGTSHQEPMVRAQKEWDRRFKERLGSWNYAKHRETLETFWREGIRRNRNYESIVTIGLRGADDTPMAPGGPEENRTLLERIIDVQRKMLAQEVDPDVTKIPQLWCLYKEVLEFYNAGMRAPDDVTLLWPDDNWGNIRRLPTAEERKRSGGAGIYYHFDYHGSPRSYQWINTNPIPKIWEQMSLAKQYGADRIWIVNVGHFKGYELPLEFFLDFAWNAGRWTNSSMHDYTRRWTERQFGQTHAREIAGILSRYTKYNGRRKPELLRPSTYSLVNYREADRVVAEFREITEQAEKISRALPEEQRNAFYQLVLFPVKASAIVNELYVAAGKNGLYARQGRASTNDMAARTRELFTADTALMGHFNRDLAGGKWDHFMDQAHLGYTAWNDPPNNSLRAIDLVEDVVHASASMGVAVEGSEGSWPGAEGEPLLPRMGRGDRRWVELFNRGKTPFAFTASTDRSWITFSARQGLIEQQTSLWVSIDRKRAPRGEAEGTVTISGTGRSVAVKVRLAPVPAIPAGSPACFVEGDGYVAMEAEHFTRATESGENHWLCVEDYGHTLSAMRSTSVPGAPEPVPGEDAPRLEYRMFLAGSGGVTVRCTFGATLNSLPGRDLRYAVSFDEDPPQVVTLVPKTFIAQHGNMEWERVVADNARHSATTHVVAAPGLHVLKVWMVDPGVVLQRIVVDRGGMRESYLGPPESLFRPTPGR